MEIKYELPSKELLELVLNKKDVLVISWNNRNSILYSIGYSRLCNISVNDFIDACQEYFYNKYSMNLILCKFRHKNSYLNIYRKKSYFGYICRDIYSDIQFVGETKLDALLKMCKHEIEKKNHK